VEVVNTEKRRRKASGIKIVGRAQGKKREEEVEKRRANGLEM
jgi:hypothetical protein